MDLIVLHQIFKKKINSKTHTRIHTGQKQFAYDIHKKTLARKENLMQHNRVHAGVKRHECKNCVKSFPTKSKFTRHEKKTSNFEAYPIFIFTFDSDYL